MTADSGRLGPYAVGAPIASGQWGEWFEASEPALERPVFVIVVPLPKDPTAADEVRGRARRLASVTDARLLPVYGQGENQQVVWLATRQIDGKPMSEIRGLDERRAGRLGAQVARQLAALQDAGVAPDELAAEDVFVEGADRDEERAWLLPDPGRPAGDDASTATQTLVRLLEERVGRSLLEDPSPDPQTFANQLASLGVERPGRPRVLLGASLGLALLAVVAAGVAVSLTRDSGSTDANTPPARVAARIPLAATISALAAGDENVWAATPSGALINVDIESQSVVGTPLALFPENAYLDLVSDGDSVWAGGPRLLLRLNSATGRVLERQPLGAREVSGLLPTDGTLWVTVNDTRSPLVELVKFTPGLEREIDVGPAGLFAVPVVATGEEAWALGGDASLTRLRVGRASTTIGVGGQAGFPTEHEGRVWIPTRADRTIVAVDPVRMSIEHVLHFDAEPGRAIAGGGSIWVLTQNPSQIHRIDPGTGEFLGPPLEAPTGATFIRFGGGSLWVDDPKGKRLVRLTPSDPAPKPRQVEVDPGVLRNGPIPRDVRLRVTALEPHFSIEALDDGWLAEALTGPAAQFELFRQRRPGPDYVGVSIGVTDQAFGPGGRLVPMRTPNDFLRILRQNPSIRVSRVEPTTLGGRPGLKVRFATNPQPPFPEFCRGAPCVLLFPQERGTFVLLPGNEEFMIVQHGSGVFFVDATLSDRTDPHILRQIRGLVDSIQFER
jgi:hypothetical protein